MKPKVKKGLLIGGGATGLFLLILVSLPFFFKGQISSFAKEKINNMLNAHVDYKDVNISFIRSFPHVSVKLEDIEIIGKDSFATDTLVQAKDINIIVNLTSVFSGKGYEIRKIELNQPQIYAHVLPSGKANWDIVKKDSTASETSKDSSKMSFKLQLKNFSIINAKITYFDEQSKMKAVLQGLNHQTTGDLTADYTQLDTQTSLQSIDFSMDGLKYLNKVNVKFNANIDANLNEMKFTFSKNESQINEIPFTINGWFKMLQKGYDMDLTLDASKVDFKAILSMVPAIYSNSFEGLTAGGKVSLTGFMKGKMIDETYPKFNFKLQVDNGWFKYPSVPGKVDNINVLTVVSNPGTTVDATVVDISRFSLNMLGNQFAASMHIASPVSDPDIKLAAKGRLDFSRIKEIYPLGDSIKLSGLFDMNMNFAGKMSYYDTKQYDKFKFGGSMSISNMLVKMASLPKDLVISNALLKFNNQYAELATFNMKIGNNDLHATGKLENFVAYALKNKTLKGSLVLNSNYFNSNDFMTSGSGTKTTADTSKLALVIIPKNLDLNMQASFKQLLYDKMKFGDAKGSMTVSNGDLKIQQLGMQAFGGSMQANGVYSTSNPKKPSVNFDMNVADVLFTEMFKQVDMIQKMAPVFEKATGKFNMKLAFSSPLKQDMMPEMNQVNGSGSFATRSVGISNVAVLSALASKLKMSNLDPVSIKDISLLFTIKDGKINTQPFNVAIADFKMNLGGSTGLDQSIAYNGKVQLPERMKIGALSAVAFKIGGTFSKPKIDLDLKNSLKDAIGNTVKAEAGKQLENIKTKAVDEARKQRDNVLKAAQEQADKLRSEAKDVGDKLVNEAQKQGDALVSKAGNPISKRLAQVASDKLVNEAKKKANDLNTKAETEATKLINKASGATNY